MLTRLGINGFGRIGRLVFRASIANPKSQVNAINDPFMDTDYLIYLLKYDSVHGKIFPNHKDDSMETFKKLMEEFK